MLISSFLPISLACICSSMMENACYSDPNRLLNIFWDFVLQIAITGKGFCMASVLATELIMNNILRIGKVNVIGDVILLLGKLCVSLLCALFAFLMLDKHKYRSGHNKISSPLVPVLVSDHQSLQHMVEFLYLGAIWMKKLMSDERSTFSLFLAVIMGAGLYGCKAFLCSGGDVDRHYGPVILPGLGRASGKRAVCAPATDGDTG